MELVFQHNPIHFLRCVAQEVRLQEETAEIIVPDSYPDIGTIAASSAEAILRGKDCRDGGVTVAGGIKGVILYTPEDGTYPRNLEVYIPFSVKFDNPALTAHSQVLCNIRVRSADARMINSRKALLRVDLGCEISAYEPATEILSTLEEPPICLQTKQAEYTTRVPLETGERSFAVSDTLEIPTGRPTVSKVYEFSCNPELTDEKLVGNKAVFKGILRCKLLYLSEDERLYLQEQTIPFSQYCELNTDYDDQTVRTQMTVTGYDLETDSDNKVGLSINLLAQCVVSGQQSVSLIEDAYSTCGTLQPQWKEYALEGSLDEQTMTQSLRHHLQGELRELLNTKIYWDYPEVIRIGDRIQVKTAVLVKAIGYDENQDLKTLSSKTEAVQELALSEGALCRACTVPTGEVYASNDAGGVEARFSWQVRVHCLSGEKLRTLWAGEIKEQEKADSQRPGLIVRTVEKDTPLWELAKHYGTTVSGIMSANHLDAPVLNEDTMLLVPMT